MNLTDYPIPVLGFAAFSGTGKTTLLEKLIPELTAQGIRVGMIKHSHHDIEMDNPKKDSYKLRKSGANQMVLASPFRTIIFSEEPEASEPTLSEQLNWLDPTKLDLVLVEGFRDEAFSKIELHRPSTEKPILALTDSNIIAIAYDEKPTSDVTHIPNLELNNIHAIVAYVIDWLHSYRLTV